MGRNSQLLISEYESLAEPTEIIGVFMKSLVQVTKTNFLLNMCGLLSIKK